MRNRADTDVQMPTVYDMDIVTAAAVLSVSPWTLRKWISAGKLLPKHGLRRMGSRTLIELPVLMRLIENNELA